MVIDELTKIVILQPAETNEKQTEKRLSECRTIVVLGDFRQIICKHNNAKSNPVTFFLHERDDPERFLRFLNVSQHSEADKSAKD